MASVAGASVENWSDSEIRTKLAELGTPVGPVTETTRKILIKKLKRLLQLQGNASSPAKPRRTLARYSSGEDSQGEEPAMPPPTKVRNLRRRTTGSAELSTLADRTDSLRQPVERAARGRRSLASTSTKLVENVDTDSDSDVPETTYEDKSKKLLRSDDSVPNRSGVKVEEPSTSRQTIVNSFTRSRRSEVQSIDKVSDYRSSLKVQEEEEEEEEEETEDDNEDEKRPAFQSDFLSRLRASGTLSGTYRPSVSPKVERSTGTSYSSPFVRTFETRPSETSYQSTFISKRDTVNSYDQKKDFDYRDRIQSGVLNRNWQSASTSNFYPKAKIDEKFFFSRYKKHSRLYVIFGILIALLILFALYLIFWSSSYDNALESDGNNYPICGKEGVSPSYCIDHKDVKPALDISKVLLPKVLELATTKQCDPLSTGHLSEITMSASDALDYLSTKFPARQHSLQKSLQHLKLIILANPDWDVEIVPKENETDIQALLFNGGFAARHVGLPIGCYLRLMAYSFIKYVVFLTLAIVSGYGILFGIRWYKKQKEQHKHEVYSMVNKILNMLSNHYEQNILPCYMGINNCRDELIPPIQRSAVKKVWDDAVEFIEKHESRVRTEIHSVRGENVKVWVWIPTGGPPLSPNTSSGSATGPILGRLL